MKMGVVVPAAEGDGGGTTPQWTVTRSFALGAEQRDFDSVWMFDHFFYRSDDGRIEGMHEAWTIVSALAATTSRVEVGTIVLCNSFRSPGLTAKMAVTADNVSGGRIILGLGAGWHDAEYEALGLPNDHRVDRLDEALRILTPLLRGETVTMNGRYHHVSEAVLSPPPDRQVPLLIAGSKPRMLRITARYADAWNTAWYGAPDDRLRQRLRMFDEALVTEGREPEAVQRTVGMIVTDPGAGGPVEEEGFTGSIDELAGVWDEYEQLGVAHMILLAQPMNERSLDRLTTAMELRSGRA
jgi:alkanesulfonate monooxygenase SsuD/methylene tetrahydromethanopterin reductase-like flavin-dependent oxidoreductase (luciferase family)